LSIAKNQTNFAAVEELTFSLDELDLAESNVLVEC